MKYYELPEWRAIVAAIAELPADNVRRRMAADWLRDRGEPDATERADFIEAQLVGGLGPSCHGDFSVGMPCPYYSGHPEPIGTPEGLLSGYRRFCPGCQLAIDFGLPERLAGDIAYDDGYEYRRGFLRTVRALWRVLERELPALVRIEPVEMVYAIDIDIRRYHYSTPTGEEREFWSIVNPMHYGHTGPINMLWAVREVEAVAYKTRKDAEEALSQSILKWAKNAKTTSDE